MPADDLRIKRILKRYQKNEQFSDAHMDLDGLGLETLQAACRRAPDDLMRTPCELDEYAAGCLSEWLKLDFDLSSYDYFVHPYARREFCSDERVPPEELNIPCEDGPPTRIPIAEGLRWASARPKDGKEHYVGAEDSDSDVTR